MQDECFMKFLVSCLVLLCLTPFAMASAPAPANSTRPLLRLGIQDFREQDAYVGELAQNRQMLEFLPVFLEQRLKTYTVVVEALRATELVGAARQGKYDIIFASSGTFAQLLPEGIYPLANLVSDRAPDPNHAEAGVLIVKADRNDLRSVADLKGKTAIAGRQSMYFAYQLPASALVERNQDPEKFFSHIRHVDLPVGNVLSAVDRGQADVGFMRACVLEELSPSIRSKYRVIAPVANSPLKCLHTSQLFPSWTVGAMGSAPHTAVETIVVALLTAPRLEPYGLRWGIANEFSKIDALYRKLKIGQYQYLRHWTLKGFLQQTWPILTALAIAVGGLLLSFLRVRTLVAKRTAELREDISVRKFLEEKNAEVSLKFHRLERLSTMGQLSNMMAHELRQPLSALHTFLNTISRVVHREGISSPVLVKALSSAQKQTERISEIADQVCTYYRKGQSRQIFSPKDIIAEVLQEASQIGLCRHPVNVFVRSSPTVYADPLEIKFVVYNLVKNSVEASDGKDPKITIELDNAPDHCAKIRCSDQSATISDEELKLIKRSGESTKSNGMGLGLAIIQTIVNSHVGNIQFERNHPRGLIVTVTLPLQPPPCKKEISSQHP